MKTKAYFTIWIQAKSIEELNSRITDNEKRGFKLVAARELTKEGNVWIDGGYRNRSGALYRHGGTDFRKAYKAEMRKLNE